MHRLDARNHRAERIAKVTPTDPAREAAELDPAAVKAAASAILARPGYQLYASDPEHICAEAALDGLRAQERLASAEAAIAFAGECRDNWDCDADAHTHGTLCRVCEAARVLTHVEGPR